MKDNVVRAARGEPVTEPPADWPADYRALVKRRLGIAADRDIALIERPDYKRRWQWETWERLQEQALRVWLLDRLENERYWGGEPQLTASSARLADEIRRDADFRGVAELYAGRPDVDLATLVEELVLAEAVPYLAAWRHTDSGRRTRAAWERVWELQRLEDAIDARCELGEHDPSRITVDQANAQKGVEVGAIPVPPKYASKDFRRSAFWSLRGKLDVPKERFILFPGCDRAADPSPVIGWAGWNVPRALSGARAVPDANAPGRGVGSAAANAAAGWSCRVSALGAPVAQRPRPVAWSTDR